ncbi:uncharacterized protein HaLaN_05399, partial [Haematococcus lacustris]
MMARADMFKQERGVAVVMEQPVYTMPSVPEGLQGRVMLQNLASIVAGLALRPRPGARVLDMCAAPGGKATLLAQLMGDQGTVVALDRTQAKMQCLTGYLQPPCPSLGPPFEPDQKYLLAASSSH